MGLSIGIPRVLNACVEMEISNFKRGHDAPIAEYERELRLSLSGISRMPEEKPELIEIAS